ncbi:helicase-associated domain-containing protein [Paraoerskovia sediminicola]|uniref:helicase-associated domain-containing protein n=1 Tax=Paraoerskovia sediminicola TaxID=1138587 RepID=UPI0033062385
MSPRTPWSVGSRDEKGALRAALDPGLHRPWVPRLRASVLSVLVAHPGLSLTTDAVLDVLRWGSPRSRPPVAAVEGLLTEAATLGITGAGAASPLGAALRGDEAAGASASASRTLPHPTPARVAELGAALDALVPPPVDEVLLQGDLTGIVPGRPGPALEALLADSADVESRGAAVTVRFSGSSVTRALDAGRTADQLLAALGSHSRTPVPQPLEYLVRDAARRHGRLRVGSATSYLRSDDPAALAGLVDDRALRALGLFAIAPTVLAAHAPAAEVRAALRERGLSPTVEGPDGQVIAVGGSRARIPGRARPAWVGGVAGRRVRSLRPDPRAASVLPDQAEDPARRTARLTELAERLLATGAPAVTTVTTGTADGATSVEQGGRAMWRASEGKDVDGERSADGTNPGDGHPDEPDGRDDRPQPAPAGDRTPSGTSPSPVPEPGTNEPADALAMLRDAIEERTDVLLEVVGTRGTPEIRRVRPLRLDGGRLRALDTVREAELTVAVHRIASVQPT